MSFKPTQYVQQERKVEAADTNGIRERWFWGLRLLRDKEAQSAGGGGLRHGIAENLIAAEEKAGFRLSQREIQWRLQAARTYTTESQIRTVSSRFGSWYELRIAGFPPIDKIDGEHPADHRTKQERDRDAARRVIDLVGAQGSLFPLDEYEPTVSTVKDLIGSCDYGEGITANFSAHDRKKRDYVNALLAANGHDEDMTWIDAHRLAFPEESGGDG